MPKYFIGLGPKCSQHLARLSSRPILNETQLRIEILHLEASLFIKNAYALSCI